MRRVFAAPPSDQGFDVGDRDAGLFGPDSVTWRVHSNLSMLVGGIRALIVQTLDPLAMAGVADHSLYRSDPLGRLRRTAAFIAATTFGTTAEAAAAVARVRAIHDAVQGVAPDGRPYAASDPDLLAWVHHVEVQSFLVAYQRVGPGLAPADADRYVAEMARLGELLGVVDPVTDAVALDRWVPLRPRLALGLVLPGPVTGRLACEPAASALLAALGWSLGPSPALRRAQARVGA